MELVDKTEITANRISLGTIWRIKMRDEALRNLIKTNSHSPEKYRVKIW